MTVQGPVDGCRCHHQPSSGLIQEYRQRRPEVSGVIVGRQFNHHDGATQVPGLSFLGLPWQTKRDSTRLGSSTPTPPVLRIGWLPTATSPAASGVSTARGPSAQQESSQPASEWFEDQPKSDDDVEAVFDERFPPVGEDSDLLKYVTETPCDQGIFFVSNRRKCVEMR